MPKKLAPLRFTVLVARWTETAAALERIFRRLDAQGAWQYACHSIADGAGLVQEEALASDALLFLLSGNSPSPALLEAAQAREIPTLCCLDYDAVDPSEDLSAAAARFIHEADLAWVFSEEAARLLEKRARRVVVSRLPSLVEDHGWSRTALERTSAPQASFTIGCMSLPWQAEEVEVLAEPLQQMLEADGHPLRLEFVGPTPRALKDHPAVVVHDDDREAVTRAIASWHLGVAPLADTSANRLLTDRAYRLFAASGVPGIYSDMPVYSSRVCHRETGWLTPHTARGFAEALQALLAAPELGADIRRNALSDAATRYALLPLTQHWLREVSRLASHRDEKVRLLVVAPPGVTTTHVDALPACRALQQAGRIEFEHVAPVHVLPQHVAESDAVFLVRTFEPQTELLLEWTRAEDKALICAYDDDFFSLPEDSPLGRHGRQPEVRKVMERFLSECSLITVSTPPLLSRSRAFNPYVMEAIYGFDLSARPLPPLRERKPHRPVTIGFFGLQWAVAPSAVTEALVRVKRRFGDRVRFEMISGLEAPAECRHVFAWRSVRPLGWEESLRLLASRGWDIGLAPLIDTPFAAAKQATKFRDYAWAGMAMICSRVPSYERAIIDGIHGLLVENEAEAWESAMVLLVEEERLRDRLCRAARELFQQAHTLEQTLCAWEQLIWRVARYRESRGERALLDRGKPTTILLPTWTGPVSPSAPLRGRRWYRVTPARDKWQALDVLIGLHERAASGQLRLSVYDSRAMGEPLRQCERDLSEAQDNAWLRFEFAPIEESQGRRMRLHFDLEGAAADTQVSVYECGVPPPLLVSRLRRELLRSGGVLYGRLEYRA